MISRVDGTQMSMHVFCLTHRKVVTVVPKEGRRDFLPTNQDPANFLSGAGFHVDSYDTQISDAAGAAGRILRSQLDPSTNAPSYQIRDNEPGTLAWNLGIWNPIKTPKSKVIRMTPARDPNQVNRVH